MASGYYRPAFSAQPYRSLQDRFRCLGCTDVILPRFYIVFWRWMLFVVLETFVRVFLNCSGPWCNHRILKQYNTRRHITNLQGTCTTHCCLRNKRLAEVTLSRDGSRREDRRPLYKAENV